MRYKINHTPNLRAKHNKKSWQKIESKLAIMGAAELEQIVHWSNEHEHPSGGKGFVSYCVSNGWLIKAD